MPNFIGNRSDVIARGIREITGRTPIQQMVPGAKARALIETQAKEIENTGLLSELNGKKALLLLHLLRLKIGLKLLEVLLRLEYRWFAFVTYLFHKLIIIQMIMVIML